ncbi:lanthionine synthetase C family protein [Rubrivivax sp. A210]|uniref:lanthionine synthetase C family protein n=1 Tax=Rubrivivax sp. A210 TaxID=2772301 RepID=UPI00191A5DBA|nr:LanC-like protein [Rubrivivax sp. A210]
MLHDPRRHQALITIPWDEARVRATLSRIAADAESSRLPSGGWPLHVRDVDPAEDPGLMPTPLYFGAIGMVWALRYLGAQGAVVLRHDPLAGADTLLTHSRAWSRICGQGQHAAYLMGETPLLMMMGHDEAVAALIESNTDHPSRELMWGAPGSLLAALFMHRRSGQARWAELFRRIAAGMWQTLEASPSHGCCWTQDLYGHRSRLLGAAHGFAGAAGAVLRGLDLLDGEARAAWQHCIAATVACTAVWDGDRANWHDELADGEPRPWKKLMQFCHGAPGLVIALADGADAALDETLLAAGRAIWAAGPLAKGAGLCHGTAGNGYALLKLYVRTQDPLWLERARAFAMHAIVQSEADEVRYGGLRRSLWNGDAGLAIYLWDCLGGRARFPTLDVFD